MRACSRAEPPLLHDAVVRRGRTGTRVVGAETSWNGLGFKLIHQVKQPEHLPGGPRLPRRGRPARRVHGAALPPRTARHSRSAGLSATRCPDRRTDRGDRRVLLPGPPPRCSVSLPGVRQRARGQPRAHVTSAFETMVPTGAVAFGRPDRVPSPCPSSAIPYIPLKAYAEPLARLGAEVNMTSRQSVRMHTTRTPRQSTSSAEPVGNQADVGQAVAGHDILVVPHSPQVSSDARRRAAAAGLLRRAAP